MQVSGSIRTRLSTLAPSRSKTQIASAEDAVAALEQERAQLETSLAANQQKLIDQRWHIPGLKRKEREAQAKLKELEPRLFFAPKLPACNKFLLSVGRQYARRRATSSPLGVEAMESWATVEKRMCLCRGLSRCW